MIKQRLLLICGLIALTSAGFFTKAAFFQGPQMRLFLLIGQSNMSGRGTVEEQDKVTNPRIWKWNREKKWELAKEPVHYDRGTAGVGPAMAFAREIVKADPDDNVGLIPCAVGGKSMDQWKQGDRLYNETLATAREALKSGKLAGILWHQGEADRAPELVTTYPTRFGAMIAQLRKDLNAPNVPVIIGEIGRFRKDQDDFNAMLPTVVQQVPNCALVSAEGLTDRGDKLHFSAAAQRILGKRYAEAFLKITHSPTTVQPEK